MWRSIYRLTDGSTYIPIYHSLSFSLSLSISPSPCSHLSVSPSLCLSVYLFDLYHTCLPMAYGPHLWSLYLKELNTPTYPNCPPHCPGLELPHCWCRDLVKLHLFREERGASLAENHDSKNIRVLGKGPSAARWLTKMFIPTSCDSGSSFIVSRSGAWKRADLLMVTTHRETWLNWHRDQQTNAHCFTTKKLIISVGWKINENIGNHPYALSQPFLLAKIWYPTSLPVANVPWPSAAWSVAAKLCCCLFSRLSGLLRSNTGEIGKTFLYFAMVLGAAMDLGLQTYCECLAPIFFNKFQQTLVELPSPRWNHRTIRTPQILASECSNKLISKRKMFKSKCL